VIGAGMIGAAAARHLAEAGRRIAVIGPPEPAERSSSLGPFASHYDAGRITRIIDVDPLWSELAARSIGRYRDLTDRSGVAFHEPVGLAWIKQADQLEQSLETAVERGGDVRLVDPDQLRRETGIAAPVIDGLGCAYEGPPAGFVNPRRLVEAELRLAGHAGATVVPSVVTGLRRSARSISVTGPFGEVVSEKVLMATGMYGGRLAGNAPTGADVAMTRWPRTTVRLELNHKPDLPSLIAFQVREPGIDRIYWVPPVRYPDGRIMLKIGGVYEHSEPLQDEDQITTWFQGAGSADEATALRGAVHELLPEATVVSWESVPCVVTETETGYPYLGWIDEDLAVAVGGNGGAAKSCDEIGRLAASLFEGEGRVIDPGLDLSPFEPLLQS
jgi:sarcosine oxidase